MPGVAREMKSPAEIKAEQLRQQRGSASPLLLQDTGLKADREGIPSRDRVSAAIALVRARQAARTLSPTQSPRSTKGSTIGNSSGIVASGNKGNQSPMRKPLSSTKGNSPDIEAHRSNQSPLRMPLSQKTQDSCAPMHSMEAPRLSQPNASVTLSPRAKPSFFTNIFASRALSLPALVRTADENNNQENAPEHHRHEEETPVTSRSDVVKSSRATPSSAVARNSAPRPPISPGDIAVPLVNSNDSDDFSLDPQTLTDVARFIDAVHNKHKLKVPANPTPKKQPILQPASSESTDYDDYSPVSPETLAGIGHYIDAMAKPKEKSILVSATSSSDGDDTIPVETKVGIGAFIDALHNKSIVQEETKQTLYVSSSEDSSTAHAEQSEIEKYYQCRSLDEDDGLQLLSAVLSDGLEMEEHDGEGEEQTIDDAMNLSLAISPNPSDLAGEGFLGVEPASPVDEIGAPLQDPAMLLSAVLSDKVEMEELDGEGEEQTIDDAVNLSLAISPNPSNLAEEGFLGVEPASPDDEIEAPLQDPASCIDADDTTLSEREDEIEDPGRSIDADETTLSEREIEDPVSIIDAEETAMSECEDEIKDSGSSTDAEETAMSECEDEIEDSGSSTDAEETAMSEREDEIEDSGSSTDADETAISECEDEIEFPGSSTDAAETAMSEREDEIEDPGSSIDADETAMAEREDDIEDPVSIIDDDETAMSEREDDIEDPVSIVDDDETAMSEREIEDPVSFIDADETAMSEREDEIEDPVSIVDDDETAMSEREDEIEDPVSIVDAEETAMSEREEEIEDPVSIVDAEETAMSEREDEIEDVDAEETAMSEREEEIEDSGSSTDADETAMSQCEDEIEFPGSSTDAAETAMSEREDEIEDPGSSIDADETAMSEREDDIEDPVSIIDDDETAMSEREDDIEDPVSIVDAEETAMSEREEEIEDPGRSIDAGETVTSERDPATNSDISTTDSSCGEDPGPAPSEWNHQNDRVDEKIENEVIAGTESIEMPIVVNSEDVLDDAALVGETGATLTDEEESCNIQEQNIDACELIAAFKEDLSVGSSESTQGEESPLSPQSQGPLLRVFSDMESFDEDDNITAYLSRMGANGDDAFFSKLTPPEGATEEEIAKLNAVAGGVSKECVDTTFDEHDMDHDAGELVNAFLSGETTTESSKDLVRHQQSEGVPKKVDEAVTLIAIESHEDKPSSLDSIEPYRSKECVDQDNTTDDFKSEMVIESADAQATNDVSFDDVAGELINAFLRGAEDAPLSPESEGQMKNEFSSVKSGVVEKESTDDLILSVRSSVVDEETIDDLIEDLVATIGESDSAVFVKLALGASNDKLKKLKSFIRAVAPYLTGQSAPLVAEAEIRGVAIRVGITEDEVEKVIEQMSFFGENLPSISEVSSADLANIFNDEKFDHMEEIDETENISAFLSRMTALEAGGHFGETEANDIVTEEAVEIDLDHGFVNRKLETVLSDEAPWWNEEDEKAEEDPTPTTASLLVQTIFSEDEEEQESHTEEKSESIMTKKSQSTSLRKSGTPRSRSTRSRTADVERTLAEKKQKAQSTSQQRPEMVRSFVLQTQMSAELPHSISLTRVPSMLSDLETMFEEREQRMSRSNKAKQGEWKSPWDKRWVSSGAERMPTKSRVTPTVSRYAKAPRIGGVAAAMKLSTWSSRPDHGRRMIPVKQHWRLAYKERTKNHPGYSNVDVYSIYEASVVVAYKHPYDEELWENRDVKQRFLHEKSISLSRNWFGALLRKRGNDRYREPVAEPKSMEMPMEHRLGEGEWVEEWYTTWQQRQNEMKKRIERGTDRSYVSDSEESDGSETYTYGDETTRKDDDTATYGESVYTSRRSEYSRSSRHRYEDDDDDSWEEPPECGTFQNVKQKIGERLSLVHHQHLSSLRESRWRKKYFPRGTFPYK